MQSAGQLRNGEVETRVRNEGGTLHGTTLDFTGGEYRVRHTAWIQVNGDDRLVVASSETRFENYHIAVAEFDWVHDNPPTEVAISH